MFILLDEEEDEESSKEGISKIKKKTKLEEYKKKELAMVMPQGERKLKNAEDSLNKAVSKEMINDIKTIKLEDERFTLFYLL